MAANTGRYFGLSGYPASSFYPSLIPSGAALGWSRIEANFDARRDGQTVYVWPLLISLSAFVEFRLGW